MSDKQSSAAGAAQRVQAIIEAAEATARDIEENARLEAATVVANAKASLTGLVDQAESLRKGMDELSAALVELKATVEAMGAEAAAAGATATSAPAPVSEPDAPEPEPEPEAPEPDPAPEPTAILDPEPEPAKPGSRASEGARLIALNMALSGTPREETARYLRENFELDEADSLLDEVYARAGS